jgi:hypothetical protein
MLPRLVALAIAGTLALVPAWAHEWYDPYCCDHRDCKPIPEEQTPRITREGFVLHDGHFIPKGSPSIRLSQDQRFHRCDGHMFGGPVQGSFVRCLYVPSGGV